LGVEIGKKLQQPPTFLGPWQLWMRAKKTFECRKVCLRITYTNTRTHTNTEGLVRWA